MNTIDQVKIEKAIEEDRQAVVDLLQEENLPVKDLPVSLQHFLVAKEENKIIGVIGLEIYGNLGLLRSFAVNKQYRNKRIALQLLKNLENNAAAIGIEAIYLLTETAALYFEKKGYERINREKAPKSIQGSSEFSTVCPASAVVMTKRLVN
ncbi:MAG: arsenic resistance N-acetyltransferase ArsN2 [Flavisolibacter sp.]